MAASGVLRRVTSLPIILATTISLCSCIGPVPLLLWSNDRELSPNDGVFPGHQASPAEVKTHLKHYLNPSTTTILFLQDKLSLDDLTKYKHSSVGSKASAFENIKKILKSNIYSVIRDVQHQEGEEQLVKYMKASFDNSVEEVFSTDLEYLKFDSAKGDRKTLYICHLLPVKGSTDAGKLSILSKNDDIIGKVVAEVEKIGKYVAMLTASEPSDIVEKMENENAMAGEFKGKRHLLSSPSATAEGKLFNFKGCVYLYAKSIILKAGNTAVDVVNASYTASGHCESNDTTSVSIVFGKNLPPKVTHFELRMTFSKLLNTDWMCTSLDVTYSGKFDGQTQKDVNVAFNGSHEKIIAPRDMSYSCGDLSLSSTNVMLSFGHFQVQPFGIKNNRFSNAYDCVGFFTAPILTGLFVTVLLLSIVFGGVIAMMGITTMDRFDDPKGPTIQVPHE